MSETAIWLVREDALPLGQRLAEALGAMLYRPWLTPDDSPREQFRRAFHQHRRWVAVMASGIAVRYLDGLPASKYTDPALVVLDEAARFAIPLLSGHEGGANALAYEVARLTGAIPAVTTATEALKPLTLGIGCRRGKSADEIERAVLAALGNRPLAEVREVATIDIKADEAGLLEFCARHGLPLRVIAQPDVAARGWVGEPSDWVQQNVGVSGVCEPCALIASPRGQLIVPKTALDGVTVAAVEDRPTKLPA
ncbi:cobalamin biosynthesis protein [Pseudogulbenkiania ferrooxidans]|uniref:Cobalamin (Vitamin B12) biosynthesis CbiG protein n=1 Tax=Pseudogulbenkiania ferrooxidans 2002 TaxID=279714 RepID=B9Z3S6_9NEIS|nr:cobalamin biosynthesis protein [Pseudogulbenkiania ferrooxidans]EEG08503.1 cobalamin (vitamin B12) biosynthesis CbiG protein [Pseudogulbenkiania ferrooxidans 2002]